AHIFVGFVDVTATPKGFTAGSQKDETAQGIGDGDFWPAVQLNRCEHFTCADLRIERAPIALKIGHCGSVSIQQLTASAPQATKGLAAIKLQNPQSGGYIGPVVIHGIDVRGYECAVWDHSKSAANGTATD